MDQYYIAEINLGKIEYICVEPFKVWFLIFSLKEETMRIIHNRDAAKLEHFIIVFYTEELGTWFIHTGTLVCL